MSHDLNVVDGKVSMAYAGKKPWHNLGTQVSERMTTAEALKLGGLDFEVVKTPLFTRFQDGFVTDGLEEHYATMRTDTKQVLGTVKGRYNVVQNKDCFSFFDAIIDKGAAIIETVGALGRGERLWAMAKLPQDIVVKDKDVVNLYLLLAASHDGTTSIKAKFTPTRVVCQNTLSGALQGGCDVSIRHTEQASTKLVEAHRLMGIVSKQVEETQIAYNKMAKKEITLDAMDTYLNKLFFENKEVSKQGENKKDTVIKLFNSGKGNEGKTIWDLYNGVTEYIDHHKVTHNNGSNWVASNFGSGIAVRDKAFDMALAMI